MGDHFVLRWLNKHWSVAIIGNTVMGGYSVNYVITVFVLVLRLQSPFPFINPNTHSIFTLTAHSTPLLATATLSQTIKSTYD